MTHNEMINYRRNATIAEILHDAADKYLKDDYFSREGGKARYSCLAILMSIFELESEWYFEWEDWKKNKQFKQIIQGMKNLGFKTNYDNEGTIFADMRWSEVQAARYGWLKFCAMLAEEQGV